MDAREHLRLAADLAHRIGATGLRQRALDELVASGYLNAPLPTELGGAGLNLSEVNHLQRRLADLARNGI